MATLIYWLIRIGGVLTGLAAWYSLSFYGTASPRPDPDSGRTFPMPMHGIGYVTPFEGHLMYGGLLLGSSMVLVGALIAWMIRDK